MPGPPEAENGSLLHEAAGGQEFFDIQSGFRRAWYRPASSPVYLQFPDIVRQQQFMGGS